MKSEKLDPRNYCGGVAPDYGGDGYSDWRGDYDKSAKDGADEYAEKLSANAPDYIKQAMAEQQSQQQPQPT